MPFDAVPWFVGGGAHHSPEVARLLSHSATGGAEGVVWGGDLKVTATAVAGSSVRVLKGACVIPSRSVNADQQSYVGRNTGEDVAAITPTGSAGGRSDLVVARVEDPFAAGETWTPPSNPAAGPYIFTRVLTGVPASAIASNGAARAYLASLNMTAIPLAGITLPASTGTVTNAMIADLRNLARPRLVQDTIIQTPSASNTVRNTGGYITFPITKPTVAVPSWAKTASVTAHINGIAQMDGATTGYFNIRLGTLVGPTPVGWDWYTDPARGVRQSITIGARFADVTGIAGTNVTVSTEASSSSSGVYPGYLINIDGTQTIFNITFSEGLT